MTEVTYLKAGNSRHYFDFKSGCKTSQKFLTQYPPKFTQIHFSTPEKIQGIPGIV